MLSMTLLMVQASSPHAHAAQLHGTCLPAGSGHFPGVHGIQILRGALEAVLLLHPLLPGAPGSRTCSQTARADSGLAAQMFTAGTQKNRVRHEG